MGDKAISFPSFWNFSSQFAERDEKYPESRVTLIELTLTIKGMVRQNKKRLSLVAISVVLIAMLWNALSQPGIQDFQSSFEEIDLYRNENNTGPIERVYIVTTNDTLWNEMEGYGNLMPHSKLGTTKVYFFNTKNPYPVTSKRGRINFDVKFNDACLAMYLKDANGLVKFSVFPFKP